MFYYFQDKHKLLEGNPQFKEHNYMFNSYEMELYSAYPQGKVAPPLDQGGSNTLLRTTE